MRFGLPVRAHLLIPSLIPAHKQICLLIFKLGLYMVYTRGYDC